LNECQLIGTTAVAALSGVRGTDGFAALDAVAVAIAQSAAIIVTRGVLEDMNDLL
jgi:hypothetical protein